MPRPTAMSHLAITEMVDGKNVEWMEPVTDGQYQDGPLDTEQRSELGTEEVDNLLADLFHQRTA